MRSIGKVVAIFATTLLLSGIVYVAPTYKERDGPSFVQPESPTIRYQILEPESSQNSTLVDDVEVSLTSDGNWDGDASGDFADAQHEAPSLTIILTNFNAQEIIEETVMSALSNMWENCKIVIVDVGSTDDSVEIIQRLVHEYPDNFSLLRLPFYAGNSALGSNLALRLSTTTFVTFLDAGDLLVYGGLRKLAELAHTASLDMAIGKKLNFREGEFQSVMEKGITAPVRTKNNSSGMGKLYEQHPADLSMIFRRSSLLALELHEGSKIQDDRSSYWQALMKFQDVGVSDSTIVYCLVSGQAGEGNSTINNLKDFKALHDYYSVQGKSNQKLLHHFKDMLHNESMSMVLRYDGTDPTSTGLIEEKSMKLKNLLSGRSHPHIFDLSIIVSTRNGGSSLEANLLNILSFPLASGWKWQVIVGDFNDDDKAVDTCRKLRRTFSENLICKKVAADHSAEVHNALLPLAVGEFVYFIENEVVDSVELGKMMNRMKVEDLDLCVAKYQILPLGNEMMPRDVRVWTRIEGNHSESVREDVAELLSYPFTKMMRTDYLGKYNILFPTIAPHQSTGFSWQIIALTKKVGVHPGRIASHNLREKESVDRYGYSQVGEALTSHLITAKKIVKALQSDKAMKNLWLKHVKASFSFLLKMARLDDAQTKSLGRRFRSLIQLVEGVARE